MFREERLEELLDRWETEYHRGRDLPASALCGTNSPLVPLLEQEIARIKAKLSDPPAKPAESDVPAEAFAAVRYRPLRFHAAGGLGNIFVARDGELGREVALKRIKDQHAGWLEARRRFEREAEITGRLEHPGVVPVYGLGKDATGQPFYAMRFIHGQTLAEALAVYHREHPPGGDPSRRMLALRGLLGRFVAVCQAVAFAHSRGIIHRDLKPANVILGPFGETLVLDWGLARAAGVKEASATTGEAVPQTPPWDDTPTQAGAILGTPAFMSPEQASGDMARVGPSSDVFSLGATLYQLVTGKPPLRSLDQAREGEATPARKVRRDVPSALEAVCQRAMAARSEARYPSALDLAQDVERWLADEAVSAYREPWWDRSRRWGRRNRPVVTALAALVLTASVALAIGLYLVNEERNNTVKALAAESMALEQSRKAEVAAREQRQLALNTLRRVVDDIHAQLKDKPGQQGLRKALLRQAMEGLKEVVRRSDTAGLIDREQVWVHIELGDLLLYLEEGGTAEAKEQYERALEAARRLADDDPEGVTAQRHLGIAFGALGAAQYRLGDNAAAMASLTGAVQIHRRLVEADAKTPILRLNLGESLYKQGDLRLEVGEPTVALIIYKEALAIFLGLWEEYPDSDQARGRLAIAYERLGDAHQELNDLPAALTAYQEMLKLVRHAAMDDAVSPVAQRNLALGLMHLGDVELKAAKNEPALAHLREAFEITRKLAEADRGNALTQRDLSSCHERLGNVRRNQRDYPEALKHYAEALAIRRKLADANRADAQAQEDLIGILIKLGDFQNGEGSLLEAVSWYEQARDVCRRFPRPEVFGSRAEELTTRILVCRAAEEAVADPREALKHKEDIRPQVLRRAMVALVLLKEPVKATAAADMLVAEERTAAAAYDAACTYSLCVGLVGGEAGECFSDRAVDLLRKALERGYKDAARLKEDPDLESVRRRGDFQMIIRGIENR